ncbi:YhcH/YjgK/YiaL family protein [bacterium]|nr:YhcH/YjgK/YiaL family protein [bacterium]
MLRFVYNLFVIYKIKSVKGRYNIIVDDLKNFDFYINLNKNFKTVKDFLDKNELNNMEIGSYEIIDSDIYVNIDEYQTKESSLAEAHRNYIDIQIVLDGNEKIGYTNIKNGKIEIPYNLEKDIEFFQADCDFIKADNTKFFIFYPQDIHQPCISDENKTKVKKAVFKIKIN